MSVLERTHAILELLQKHSRTGMTNLEISRMLGLPPSTCHRLLRNLQGHDYIRQQNANHRYFLGYANLRLADALLESMDEAAVCLPYLEDLHRRTEETTFYARFCDTACVTMEICGYINTLVSIGRGELLPLYCSATGLATLAFLPKSCQTRLIRSLDFQPRTCNTITDAKRLASKLEEIRRTGVSLNMGELHTGINCLAAPIFNAEGVLGALAVVGTAVDLDHDQLQEYRALFLSAAAEVSEILGGAFPPWLLQEPQ